MAGRVYWHAHHALDVAVGACIGLGTSAALASLCAAGALAPTWWHPIVALVFVTGVALLVGTHRHIHLRDHSKLK